MSKSPNLGLSLTPPSESTKTFIDFRNELAGDSSTSNMMILDKKITDITSDITDIDKIVSSFVSDMESLNKKVLGVESNIANIDKEVSAIKEKQKEHDEKPFTWGMLKDGFNTAIK